MKCSAAKKWDLINDKMVITQACQNEVTCFLTNKGHWVDKPYCDSCAFWMMSASAMFGLSLEVKEEK